MADSSIQINIQDSRLGPLARRNVEELIKVVNDMRRLKDHADQAADSPEFSGVESAMGIPTGEGQTYYNLLAGALAAIDVSAVNQYVDRLR